MRRRVTAAGACWPGVRTEVVKIANIKVE